MQSSCASVVLSSAYPRGGRSFRHSPFFMSEGEGERRDKGKEIVKEEEEKIESKGEEEVMKGEKLFVNV